MILLDTVVATRNVRHFERICEVVDPWQGG
jgi:hypothetical protein